MIAIYSLHWGLERCSKVDNSMVDNEHAHCRWLRLVGTAACTMYWDLQALTFRALAPVGFDAQSEIDNVGRLAYL